MRNDTAQLGEQKISKLVLRMSVPAILAMLVTALYTMTDRLFLSLMIDKVNGNNFTMSAMTVVNPFTVVAFAFLLLLSTGSTALISLFLGEGRKDKAEKMLGNSLLLLIVGSLVLGGAGLIFQRPLLCLLGASEHTYAPASEYFGVICCGVVFLAISIGMSSNIRSEGNAKAALLTTVLGAVLNVAFDPLFIGPFHLGVKGAALATILAQGIAAVVVILYYLSGKSALRLRWKNLIPDFHLIGKSMWIGMPQFLLQLVASFIGIAYNNLLQYWGSVSGAAVSLTTMGDDCIAAYGMVTMVTQLFLMGVSGINNGVQPIFGYNYGARHFRRVRESLRWAWIFATIILSLGFVVCLIFAHTLIGLFGGNSVVAETAEFALRIQVLSWPLTAIAIISPCYFQAIGKSVLATVLAICRQLLVLLPILVLLPLWFGGNGIWYAAPIADVIAAGISLLLIRREVHRLSALSDDEAEEIQEEVGK